MLRKLGWVLGSRRSHEAFRLAHLNSRAREHVSAHSHVHVRSQFRAVALAIANGLRPSSGREGKSSVKVRLLKILLLVAVVASAVILYRGLPARRRGSPPSQGAGRSQPPEIANLVQPEKFSSDAHEAKVLAMALEKKPGHTPVLLKLAKIESEEGRYQDASRHLREIVSKEPGNAEARLELGKVLFQLGDVRGAIEQTQAILEVHPDYADALYNLGAIYGNIGNRDRAMEYWKRLVALDPHSESGQKAEQMMNRLRASAP
jgi:tetratricopeptide (TPR) repeat protein